MRSSDMGLSNGVVPVSISCRYTNLVPHEPRKSNPSFRVAFQNARVSVNCTTCPELLYICKKRDINVLVRYNDPLYSSRSAHI